MWLRFSNRRSDPVTVIGVVDIDLPQRKVEVRKGELQRVELDLAGWSPFEPGHLPEGGERQGREYALVPRDAPDARVEASYGDRLVLHFRPSRGDERWA